MTFSIYRAADGWRWKLVDSEGHVLAKAGAVHSSPDACRSEIELIKSSWRAPVQVTEDVSGSAV